MAEGPGSINLLQSAEGRKLSVKSHGFLQNWQEQQEASWFGISEMAESKLNQLASRGIALSFASGYQWQAASCGSWSRRSLKETGRKGLRGRRGSRAAYLICSGKWLNLLPNILPSLLLYTLAAEWLWHTLPECSSWLLLQLWASSANILPRIYICSCCGPCFVAGAV